MVDAKEGLIWIWGCLCDSSFLGGNLLNSYVGGPVEGLLFPNFWFRSDAVVVVVVLWMVHRGGVSPVAE